MTPLLHYFKSTRQATQQHTRLDMFLSDFIDYFLKNILVLNTWA